MTCGLYLWPLFLWWFCVHTCVYVPMPSDPLHLLALRPSECSRMTLELHGFPCEKRSTALETILWTNIPVTFQLWVQCPSDPRLGCVKQQQTCQAVCCVGQQWWPFCLFAFVSFRSVIFLRPQLGRHECLELTGTVGNSNFSRPLLS